jgi:uncharacterized protein (TIGR02147 family)
MTTYLDFITQDMYNSHMSSQQAQTDAPQLLNRILIQRQEKNTRYSKSAMARDMGISQSLLSRIFNKERSLTTSQAKKAALLLKLSKQEEKSLVDCTLQPENNPRLHAHLEAEKRKQESQQLHDLDFDQFSAIAQWHHMPLLTLLHTRDFEARPTWIAKRLGITVTQAKEAFRRLVKLGLIVQDDAETTSPPNNNVELKPKKSELAVREHHIQMMEKAKETLVNKIDDASWKNRDISSLSIAVDPARIEQAQELIKKFKEELTAIMSEGNCTEIFQMNLQLFQLSNRSEP